MYIVRWLMTHPIIAVWVLGAIAILLSQSAPNISSHEAEEKVATHQIEETQKTPDTEHEKIDNTSNEAASVASSATSIKISANEKDTNEDTEIANANKHEAVNTSGEEATTNQTKATVKAIVKEPIARAVETTSVKATTDSQEAESKTAVNKIASVVNNAKDTTINTVKQTAETLVNKSASAMVATADSKTKTVEDEIVQRIRAVQPSNTAVAQDVDVNKKNSVASEDSSDSLSLAQSSSASELLVMAREAYWNNGFDEAAEIYLQLIELKPNELDYKGELGNVYWRQGYPKKAAELYSEIALPMIENGNSDRVANMVGFIGLFYPERAAKIHQTLMSKVSGN